MSTIQQPVLKSTQQSVMKSAKEITICVEIHADQLPVMVQWQPHSDVVSEYTVLYVSILYYMKRCVSCMLSALSPESKTKPIQAMARDPVVYNQIKYT